jgi:probable HAF family extracellular repeat protein
VLLFAGSALAQPASISFVPSLGGATPLSVAAAGTPDGTYVVGFSGAPQGPEAYRWNRATGEMTALGFLGTMDWFKSKAYGVSDDGGVVVGRSDMGDHSRPIPRAFQWTPLAGMTALPYAPTSHQLGPQGNAAVAVSADGSVIVGRFETYATDASGGSFYPALMRQWCRWTSAGVGLLPDAVSPFAGQIAGISGDGATIAGFVGDGVQGTVLIGATGTALGQLPGGQRAEPIAISRDGGTVVGEAETRDADGVLRFHAFRWSAVSGLTDLGGLPGGQGPSRAEGVSGDGSIVVGSQGGRAVIWDAAHGARDLALVLTSQYGLDLQGRALREAAWVSPDGSWVVGNADVPSGSTLMSAWIAHIPSR